MSRAGYEEREGQTRRERIDPRLAAAGWLVRPFAEPDLFGAQGSLALTELETSHGPADYVLADAGDPLGVVEAKRITVRQQESLLQAER